MGLGAALSDEGKMDHARGFSDHTKRYKGRAVRCQVPGCTEEVVNKAYHKRYRICQMHCNLPSVNLNGQLQRWCQQCGRFQPLSDFEGDRKTCKAKLEQHNSRRRTARSKARKDDDLPEHHHLQNYQQQPQHRAASRGGGLLGAGGQHHDYGTHQHGSSSYSGHSDLAGGSSSSLDAVSPTDMQGQRQQQRRLRRRRQREHEDGFDDDEMYDEQEEVEEQQHGRVQSALVPPSAARDRAHDGAKRPALQPPPQLPGHHQVWPRQDFSPSGKGILPAPPPLFQPPAPPQPSQQPAVAAGTPAGAAAPATTAPGPAPWEQLLAVVAAPRSKAQTAWPSPPQQHHPHHQQPRQQQQQQQVLPKGGEQPAADALAGADVARPAGHGFRLYAGQQEQQQRVMPPSTRQAYEAGLLGSASAAAAASSAGGLPKELPGLNPASLWASRGPAAASDDGAGRHAGGAAALRDRLPVPLGQEGLGSAGALGEPTAVAAQLLPLLSNDSQLQQLLGAQMAATAGSAAARGAAAPAANPALPAQILQDLAALPGGSELATIVVASALAQQQQQQQQRRHQQPGPAQAHDPLASFGGLDESLQGLLSVGADPSSLASLPAWMSWPPGVFQQGSEKAGVDDTAQAGAPAAAAPVMPPALPLPGSATAAATQLAQLEPLMSLLGVACGMGGSAPAVLQTHAANGLLRAALPQQRRAASPPPAWRDPPRPSDWPQAGQQQQQQPLRQPRRWDGAPQQQQQQQQQQGRPAVGLSAFSAPARQGKPPVPGSSAPGAAWAIASDPGPACSSFWTGIRPSLQPQQLLRVTASQPEGLQPQQQLEQQRRWQEVWEAQQTGRQLGPGISSLVTGSGASVESLAVQQQPAADAVGNGSVSDAKQLSSGGKGPGVWGLQGQLNGGGKSGLVSGEEAALLKDLGAADLEEFVERAAQVLLHSSPDKLPPTVQAALLQLAASVAVAAEAEAVPPALGEANQGTPSQKEVPQLAQPGSDERASAGEA